MRYLSQLREGEDLFYIDLRNLNKGVKTTKAISVVYEHKDAVAYGCGFSQPRDTWTIRFNTEIGERYIQFNTPSTEYKYLEFMNAVNKNGQVAVNEYRYIVGADKDIIIKQLKKDNEETVKSISDRKATLERELTIVQNQYNVLTHNLELLNELIK